VPREASRPALAEVGADEGVDQAGEIGAAADAADYDVGVLTGQLEGVDRLLADHRLVQADMVEDRAEGVVGIVAFRRHLDRLGDRDPEAARLVGGLRAAGLGAVGGAAVDGPAPGLDHRPAVGLLVVGDADHEDLALEAEELAGEREGGPPLSRSGLGDQLLDPRLLVEVGLGDGRVRLVGAGRRDALVLVVDVRRRIELALQPPRPDQRGRPPELVDLSHLLGDLDLGLRRDLLFDHPDREDRRQVLGPGRLPGPRVERRQRLARQFGQQVDPARRDPRLVEQVLGRRHAAILRPPRAAA
jgi:hypothetical protein